MRERFDGLTLAVALIVGAVWLALATGVSLVWVAVLGNGSNEHPHGTSVLWISLAVMGVLALSLALLAWRLQRGQLKSHRVAWIALLPLVVLALVPPYTTFSLTMSAIQLAAVALAAAVWAFERRASYRGVVPGGKSNA